MERVAQHNADRCPKCNSGLVDALAQDRGIRRYQCRKCGETYNAIIGLPAIGDDRGEPVARIPDDPKLKSKTPYKNYGFGEEFWNSPFSRTALGGEERKEANMADLKCPEHPELTFPNPQAFGAHNRHAHPGRAKPRGEKKDGGDGSVQENPDLPMGRPRKSRKSSRRKEKTQTRRSSGKSNGITGNVIKMLEDKRAERIAILVAEDPELKEIDEAIVKLGGRPL